MSEKEFELWAKLVHTCKDGADTGVIMEIIVEAELCGFIKLAVVAREYLASIKRSNQ